MRRPTLLEALQHPLRRLLTTATALLLSDFCALFLSLIAAFCLRALTGGDLPLLQYLWLVPGLLFFLPLYAALGVYPDVFRQPSDELKRLTLGTCLGFLFISMLFFVGKQGDSYSRFVLLFCWLLALPLVPLFRYYTRGLCANKSWWGYPVLLFAPRQAVAATVEGFLLHQERGLYIAGVAYLDTDGATTDSLRRLHLATDDWERTERIIHELKKTHPEAIALILADSLAPAAQQSLVLLIGKYFQRVIVQLDTPWLKQSSLRVADIPSGQALTLRQNLLDPTRMRMKRAMDMTCCLLGSVVLALAIPLIALCIRLDSRGPVFFTQNRIGQGGKTIRVIKFRTMAVNAEKILDKALAEDPQLKQEWADTQKLTRDPRLTKLGVFLRHTSLDELPQIFNVIRGEMSLVGPRPIVESEIARYGDGFDLYTRVKPGITGLWQVSGRNALSYAKRVELDRYYVYNWSVWLDIYIIIRTVPAVLFGKGAY